MIRNVIFDLDGTLLDTSKGIIESVKHTINTLHLPVLTNEELRTFIGPPLKLSFMNTCGCSEEQANEAVRVFRAYYQEGAVLHAEHYQGLLAMCDDLKRKRIKMGVATNKPNRFAVELIRNFDLRNYCASVFGADEKGELSKSDLIKLCMKDMNADKLDTVLIGDTANDAVGAERAGISFIAVTYGFGFRKGDKCSEYPSCIGVADSPVQIADIINEINSKTVQP